MKNSGARFRIALSFPGECRPFVEKAAAKPSQTLGQDAVFDDVNFEHELTQPNLDLYPRNIYRLESDLVAPFFAWNTIKKWRRLEWRYIRAIIFDLQSERFRPIRFEDAKITGLLPFDGFLAIGRASEVPSML